VSILPGIYASQITGHLVTGSYDSIATVTVGSGGQSTISFSSIPSTYKHLQLRVTANDNGGGGGNMFMQMNSDTGNNYAWHYLQGTGSNPVGAGSATTTSSFILGKSGYTPQGNGVSVIDILDYSNTNKYKTTRVLNGTEFNTTSGVMFFSSGLWQNTASVSSFTITTTGGSFTQYSSFALYGIKG
jgi:hypothetical protein